MVILDLALGSSLPARSFPCFEVLVLVLGVIQLGLALLTSGSSTMGASPLLRSVSRAGALVPALQFAAGSLLSSRASLRHGPPALALGFVGVDPPLPALESGLPDPPPPLRSFLQLGFPALSASVGHVGPVLPLHSPARLGSSSPSCKASRSGSFFLAIDYAHTGVPLLTHGLSRSDLILPVVVANLEASSFIHSLVRLGFPALVSCGGQAGSCDAVPVAGLAQFEPLSFIRNVARFGLAPSVLDSQHAGLPTSLRGSACLEPSLSCWHTSTGTILFVMSSSHSGALPSAHGLSCSDAPLLVLEPTHCDASLLLRAPASIDGALPTVRSAQPGAPPLALSAAQPGASLLARSAAHLGPSTSCTKLTQVGPPPSSRWPTRLEASTPISAGACLELLPSLMDPLRLEPPPLLRAPSRVCSPSIFDLANLDLSLSAQASAAPGSSAPITSNCRPGASASVSSCHLGVPLLPHSLSRLGSATLAPSACSMDSSLLVRTFLRLGPAVLLLGVSRLGLPTFISGASLSGPILPVRSAVRLDSAPATLQAASLDLALLARGLARADSSSSLLGCMHGAALSVLAFADLGPSLSTQSFGRTGPVAFALDLASIGPVILVQSFACCGSLLFLLSAARMDLSSAVSSHASPELSLSTHGPSHPDSSISMLSLGLNPSSPLKASTRLGLPTSALGASRIGAGSPALAVTTPGSSLFAHAFKASLLSALTLAHPGAPPFLRALVRLGSSVLSFSSRMESSPLVSSGFLGPSLFSHSSGHLEPSTLACASVLGLSLLLRSMVQLDPTSPVGSASFDASSIPVLSFVSLGSSSPAHSSQCCGLPPLMLGDCSSGFISTSRSFHQSDFAVLLAENCRPEASSTILGDLMLSFPLPPQASAQWGPLLSAADLGLVDFAPPTRRPARLGFGLLAFGGKLDLTPPVMDFVCVEASLASRSPS